MTDLEYLVQLLEHGKNGETMAAGKARAQSAITTIDRNELDSLILRVEHAIEHDLAIEAEDLRLLLQAIQTLAHLQTSLEDKDTTLFKMKKLLGLAASTERNTNGAQAKRKSGTKKPRKKPAAREERIPQTIEHHEMTDLAKGETCPSCDIGKLYSYQPAELLRITGLSPLSTTKHIAERLRCNACGELFTAKLSDEVLADGHSNQMYGHSARAILAINKYFAATPFYRVENIQKLFGTPVTASTQYDQCEAVAFACEPILEALQKAAAQAPSILVDDTHNKIIMKEAVVKPNRTKKGSKLRIGVYSSGLLAKYDTHDIILYNTDIGHAGEMADSILQHRDESRPPPNYMGDASSNNAVTVCMVQKSLCNAHARRQFFDVEHHFPDEVSWLLDEYEKVWHHNKESDMFTPVKRLEYHRTHSQPVMDSILAWCEKSLSGQDAEHYSGLAKAQKYFIKHFEGLSVAMKGRSLTTMKWSKL